MLLKPTGTTFDEGLVADAAAGKRACYPVCVECNNSFSADEEYMIALLGCIMCGTADPGKQQAENVAAILLRNKKLRERIEKSRREYKTIGGETKTVWDPDRERIERVVVKNARGHVFFELGELMLEAPSHVWFAPLDLLSPSHSKPLKERWLR